MNELDWELNEEKRNRQHFSSEPGFESKRSKRFEQLIREKNLKPGDHVHLPRLKMDGTIKNVDMTDVELPVVVEREDGQTHSYSPEEVDQKT